MCIEPPLPRQAGRLAVNLGHHLADVDALGDTMTVAAVRRRDTIRVGEMHHDACGAGFLARIEMHEPGNVAFGEFDVQAFLEFANRPHGPIRFQKFVFAQWEGIFGHWHLPPWVFGQASAVVI